MMWKRHLSRATAFLVAALAGSEPMGAQQRIAVVLPRAVDYQPGGLVLTFKIPSDRAAGLDVLILARDIESGRTFEQRLARAARPIYGEDAFEELRDEGYFGLDQRAGALDWLEGWQDDVPARAPALMDSLRGKMPRGAELVAEPQAATGKIAARITISSITTIGPLPPDLGKLAGLLRDVKAGTTVGAYLWNFVVDRRVTLEVRVPGRAVNQSSWQARPQRAKQWKRRFSGHVADAGVSTPGDAAISIVRSMGRLTIYPGGVFRSSTSLSFGLGLGHSDLRSTDGIVVRGGGTEKVGEITLGLIPVLALNLGFTKLPFTTPASGTVAPDDPVGEYDKATSVWFGPRVYLPIDRGIRPFVEAGYQVVQIKDRRATTPGADPAAPTEVAGDGYLQFGVLFTPRSLTGPRGGLNYYAAYRLFRERSESFTLGAFTSWSFHAGLILRFGRY